MRNLQAGETAAVKGELHRFRGFSIPQPPLYGGADFVAHIGEGTGGARDRLLIAEGAAIAATLMGDEKGDNECHDDVWMLQRQPQYFSPRRAAAAASCSASFFEPASPLPRS